MPPHGFSATVCLTGVTHKWGVYVPFPPTTSLLKPLTLLKLKESVRCAAPHVQPSLVDDPSFGVTSHLTSQAPGGGREGRRNPILGIVGNASGEALVVVTWDADQLQEVNAYACSRQHKFGAQEHNEDPPPSTLSPPGL